MSKIFQSPDRILVNEIINKHFDHEYGTPFWLKKMKERGITKEDIKNKEDINRYFSLLKDDNLKEEFDEIMRKGNYKEITPRSELGSQIVGESGGTTGKGKRAPFNKKNFDKDIVEKTNKLLDYENFPRNVDWLSALPPFPPHSIGLYGIELAQSRGGQAFGIDLDPRILKKFGKISSVGNEEESKCAKTALNLYMDHLGKQIKNNLESRNDIKVIFTTPIILSEVIPEYIDPSKLEKIEGVYFGGTKMNEDNYKVIREEIFPNASTMGIYGSGHLGCCGFHLPLEGSDRIIYAPNLPKVDLEVVDENKEPVGYNDEGKIVVSKFSEEFLMPQYPDEDVAMPVQPPKKFEKLGVKNTLEGLGSTSNRKKKEIGGVY